VVRQNRPRPKRRAQFVPFGYPGGGFAPRPGPFGVGLLDRPRRQFGGFGGFGGGPGFGGEFLIILY